jgi:predicted DNA-binding protein (MmcQ/YjbR family)
MAALDRVRTLCLAMPEAFEVEAWNQRTFRVGKAPGKLFCIAAPDSSRMSVKADPMEREALLAESERYYLPPYTARNGWVGIRLDIPKTPWDEVAELVATSYCLIAPKKLAAQVTAPPSLR